MGTFASKLSLNHFRLGTLIRNLKLGEPGLLRLGEPWEEGDLGELWGGTTLGEPSEADHVTSPLRN